MKTKSIILALTTLAIGFLLGMLTSSQLRSKRLNPVRVFFSEERFKEGMYQAIQPTEVQKAKIDQILDKYSKLNSEAGEVFRKEFEARMIGFRSEIDANLTPEQAIRLKELDEQRKKLDKQRKRIKSREKGYDKKHDRSRFDRLDKECRDSAKNHNDSIKIKP